MAIEAGQQLLHYRLIEKIGEGGMGVVWKALDTTLGRDVAIKVLPAMLAGDADRLARFEREAKLLGSLNHPNIATLHGLHKDGEIIFLAMELVEGDDLFKRLSRGPLPQGEAIEIGRQIAEGLEAAHAAGVIHRDIKPANINVASDGRVKLLDFGLARAFESASVSGSGEVSPTMSPTLTSTGTMAGVILGTAAYMSPEQARGHTADSRADVWAFGVVLYEMLSGRSAFKGDTVSDTLASVLKLDPDFNALPPTIPHRIRRLVTRCLQKDRKQRLHHIADARIILDETIAGVPDEDAQQIGAARASRTTERLLWVAAVAIVGIVASIFAWNLQSVPTELPHRKILLTLDGVDPHDPDLSGHQISPDGKRIVYINGEQVFIRDLDDWDSREIPAAAGANRVFWSHDGESIGFVRDETLSRVSADGSRAAVVSDLSGLTRGAAWGSDGKILLTGTYSNQTALYEVSERGGEPEVLLLPETEDSHFHNIHILPSGRGVLITVHQTFNMMSLKVLTDGKLKTLLKLQTRYQFEPVYSTSGHVVYTRGDTNVGLWALPFSLDTLDVTGEPFLVAANGASPSVSEDGTLIYNESSFNLLRRLVWVDRQGEIIDSIGQPQDGFNSPKLSPDGRRVVVSAASDSSRDLWVVDVARGTQTRLTSAEGRESGAYWTLDGKRVIYIHRVEDEPNTVMIINSDGSGEPEKLVECDFFSLSHDGKHLVFSRGGGETKSDLWFLELGAGGEPQLVVQTASNETGGRVSPDGLYIAYTSNDSGRNEIYLKRFPSGQGKWQASVDGGWSPHWSPKGDELFWVQEGTLMVIEVQTKPEPMLGTPRNLFSWQPAWMLDNLGFDITADAERFVLIAQEDLIESDGVLRLVENWSGE